MCGRVCGRVCVRECHLVRLCKSLRLFVLAVHVCDEHVVEEIVPLATPLL